MMTFFSSRLPGALFFLAAFATLHANAQTATPEPITNTPTVQARFATVNGQEISAMEFEAFARDALRRKFYHGTPPEAELNKVLKQTGLELVYRVLLPEIAAKRGITADQAKVSAEMEKFDAQYANNPAWKSQREEALPRVRSLIEASLVLPRLEENVRNSVDTSDTAVRKFYDNNPLLFTEPKTERVSVIVLRIDPSAPPSTVEAVKLEATELHKQLLAGAKFDELAKEHSADKSADNGGDMGFVHRGQLAEELHLRLDAAKPGDLLEPIRVLEGWAIVQLNERRESSKRSYEEVKDRAKALLARDAGEKAWNDFRSEALKTADVKYGEAFVPMMTSN